jgi:hypothetical protein
MLLVRYVSFYRDVGFSFPYVAVEIQTFMASCGYLQNNHSKNCCRHGQSEKVLAS